MNTPALFILCLIFSLSSLVTVTQADDYESPDQYYRPMTMRDIDYRLLPSFQNGKDSSGYMVDNVSGFRNRGCPQDINIGGIGSDTRVIGNVDINVTIDQDFIINCNSL